MGCPQSPRLWSLIWSRRLDPPWIWSCTEVDQTEYTRLYAYSCLRRPAISVTWLCVAWEIYYVLAYLTVKKNWKYSVTTLGVNYYKPVWIHAFATRLAYTILQRPGNTHFLLKQLPGHILRTKPGNQRANCISKKIFYNFTQNFLMTFLNNLHINVYFSQPKPQLQLHNLGLPFSTAIFILQLQKIRICPGNYYSESARSTRFALKF